MNLNAHLGTMTDNVICFTEAKKKIEDRRLAAADEYLRQQDWFLEAEVRLKKRRDYIIFLIIIDCIIGLVAIMV